MLIGRFNRWRLQRSVQNAFTLGLVILGPALAGVTFFVMGPLDQGSADNSLRVVLLADLVYILVVAGLVAERIMRLVAARRARSAGSRLYARLTGVFVLLALLPTVLVAVFAVLSINVGLEGWFSERVGNVLNNSVRAAEAYKDEHRQELTRDANALASYLNIQRQATPFMSDGEVREALAAVQSTIDRSLSEAFVIDATGEYRARAVGSYQFDMEPLTAEDIAKADRDGSLIFEDWDNNEFRIVLPLDSFLDRYLYVSRPVDGAILNLLDETQETVSLYNQIESDRGRLLFEFGLIYIGFAVILILAAIWLAIWFAERLSRPVGRLVSASQRVGAGDLNVRVYEEPGDDEIAQLSRDFNKMTQQLNEQRKTLIQNTNQIEERRRLFDSVLTSITSGVVGLDSDGAITFVNRSGERLLDMEAGMEAGSLVVAVPEFGPLFDSLHSEGREVVQAQVNLIRAGHQEALLVRMSTRRTTDGTLEGYVVAFDDVTDLVTAQRTAAWGDVARRIAHEIKNPLTPIQLSAERIKRKFAPKVGEESDTLEQMTDVIVRQTNDLRRIVDEFSRFARMPEPIKVTHDLSKLVHDAVMLQTSGQPEVKLVETLVDNPVPADVDATMIGQALTNLIKNAGEAIETRKEKLGHDVQPEIRVTMELDGKIARICISDNGIGLPEDRGRLFEPYVTTRDKGTGLGLPIVKKIIEEHGGILQLQDAEEYDGTGHIGAKAVIELPIRTDINGDGAQMIEP
ncbi:PAS domain-containing sensor histidine kinase [Marivivens donghaensis]|uniref:histidine kinase n=1 Tax=Marivivens donghaensis TaxID=1699413 RepID=A0ABX0VYN7_9RHOB|nr:PAS domain-containing sensor histidine kinase [Marivivens donghaensis]NIY72934.1 PAS domain-containing sensor histidine kinase [Marivivens donghaensis]